jgi:signal transduction histidine kinase
MHQNLKTVMENMPEGVLIFEKASQKVMLFNEKLISMLRISDSKANQPHIT